jgi:RNA polymerase sigma factor (sigma-70 family)
MQDQQQPAPSRAEMIESFAWIARHVVRHYRHWSLDQEDIFQTAMLAVIQAIDDYDAKRGIPLGAYITNKVRWKLGIEIERAQLQTRPDTRPTPANDDDDDHAELWAAIDQLPTRDRAILIGTFGLDGTAPVKRPELGRRHGRGLSAISRSTVRSKNTLRQALSA